jgi:hypothetical protein
MGMNAYSNAYSDVLSVVGRVVRENGRTASSALVAKLETFGFRLTRAELLDILEHSTEFRVVPGKFGGVEFSSPNMLN